MSTTSPKQDLDRIRKVRDRKGDSSEEIQVEVLTCPIKDCSRTIIDDPRDLRSHVREAGGDHEGLSLNENLEIIEYVEPEDDERDESGENAAQSDSKEESDDGPTEEEESPEKAEIDSEAIGESEYHALWAGNSDDDNGLWGPGVPKKEVR
ncbi:hypothetical protein [Natronococcus sp. A-GB7]|uniref:hypothetical protein n=1 Tax=Natronococcus sp. A-GB7 TaxID=3037649 RepID=UPI00241EE5BE|nr:hypothetical protein [Natronococcus sp. A-GB7]MDG5821925.1 hypothetical protein [Natronococcus sp. A-GB7]